MRKLKGLLLYCLFLLVATEILLWVSAWLSPAVRLALTNRFGQPPFIQDDRLGLRPNPEYGDHDAAGYRNARVLGNVDLVALGDSQTYGICAGRDQAWPQQVAAKTGLSVYNMACGTWCPVHYLLLLDSALSHRPKYVISALYAGNDPLDAVSLVYRTNSVPEYRGRRLQNPQIAKSVEKGWLGAVEFSKESDRMVEPDFRADGASQIGAPAGISAPRTIADFLREHCKVWGMARAFKGALAKRAGVGASSRPESGQSIEDAHWGELRKYRGPVELAFFEKGKVRTVLQVGYRSLAFTGFADGVLAEGEDLCIDALERVDARVKAGGAKHVVLLIPTKEFVYYPIVDESVRSRESYSALAQHEKDFWARVKTTLEKNGIEFVDAVPAMREAAARGEVLYPYSTQSHPIAYGYEVIADCVAALPLHR